MEDFAHVLNWTLLSGSHEFPGPDGGTCINEAAIVAAGFPYQTVRHPRDLPACFCPVIGEFSVWLNDSIADTRLRNRLLAPFVVRLAGTRGGPEDERRRLEELREGLLAITPQRFHRRRFALDHQAHLLLGDWLGSFTVRRFSLQTAASTKELIRIARVVAAGLSAADLPGFYEAMAQVLGAMLQVGPRAPSADLAEVSLRLEEIKSSAPRELARA